MSGSRRGDHGSTRGTWWSIAFAVVAPVVVALALVPFRDHIRTANVSLVLVVVVLLAAVFGGRTGGAIAAVVSAMSFVFFFTQPYNSLAIDSADDAETTILLLIVGLAVGEVVLRSQRHRRAVEERTAEIGKMRRFAELGAGNEPAWTEIGNEVELPVHGEGREIARFVLEMPVRGTGVAIAPEDRALAVAPADQLGALLVAGEQGADRSREDSDG